MLDVSNQQVGPVAREEADPQGEGANGDEALTDKNQDRQFLIETMIVVGSLHPTIGNATDCVCAVAIVSVFKRR